LPDRAASTRFAAHRFLSAATIAARPAGDSRRFGFLVFAVEAPAAVFCSAHRRRWAAAIAHPPAAAMRWWRAGESEVAKLPFLPLPSIWPNLEDERPPLIKENTHQSSEQ
jgi:hypothetical protein